jgi:ABC-type branched-subunit amino acid transport system substrate-binding protein
MSRDTTPSAGSDRHGKRYVTRRSLLAGTSALTLGGLAGCSQNNDGNGGNGDSNDDTNTDDNGNGGGDSTNDDGPPVDEVVIGLVTPLSGPFSTGGEDISDGVELAAKHAVDEGFAGNVRIISADSGTAPATARQKAQEHINDGADFVIGTLSGSTSEAVSQLGREEETIVVGSSGNLQSSGPNCHPYWFPLNCSGRTMMMAGLGYALRQDLGTSVYQISSDFLWPQDMVEEAQEYIIPEFGGEDLGNSFVPFGETDFASQLTTAQDSGADIVSLNAYGNDLINLANQAWEFGLPQDGTVLVSPQGDITISEGYDPALRAHENFLQGMEWYHGFDSDATRELTQMFRDEYDRAPAWTAGLSYNHTMTYLEAVAEVGSTDSDTVVAAMEDRPLYMQLWGRGDSRIRACNHRPTNPSMTLNGKESGSFEGRNFYEVLNIMDDPDEYMVPCDETGCEM